MNEKLTLDGVLSEYERTVEATSEGAAVAQATRLEFEEKVRRAFKDAVLPAVEKLRHGLECKGRTVTVTALPNEGGRLSSADMIISLPGSNGVALSIHFWAGQGGEFGKYGMKMLSSNPYATADRREPWAIDPSTVTEEEVEQQILGRLQAALRSIP